MAKDKDSIIAQQRKANNEIRKKMYLAEEEANAAESERDTCYVESNKTSLKYSELEKNYTALEEVFNTTDSLFIDYDKPYNFYDIYTINGKITSFTKDNAPKKAFEVYDCKTGPSCVVLPDCQMLAEPTGEELFLYHNERHSVYECVTMGECTVLGLIATDGDGYQCA